MGYSPTSYFFDEKKWLKQAENYDQYYKESGVIIGNLLKVIDEEFQQLLREYGKLSEVELLMFQAIFTVNLFDSLEKGIGPKPDNVNQLFEVISDGTWLMLKSAFAEFTGQKNYDVYESLLRLSSKRIYLEEKWKKIENKRLILQKSLNSYKFVTCNKELDFGEIIALSRFQDHMNQLSVEFDKSDDFIDHRIRAIPSKMNITMNGLYIDFIASNKSVHKQSHSLICQIKFYYKKFMDVRFKNYDELSISDLSVFWLIFSNLTLTFVNALKAQASQGVYYAFSKEELIEVLLRCTDFSLKKSDQIISLFTNEKSLLKTSDLYLKPLYEKDGKIHLCVPTLLTGQFTRVVDFYINNEVEPAVSNQKTQNKGKFFELDFGHELTTQIDNNEVLSNIFCKVLKIGFDQEKGKDNEEIDIVLRIGETYLIIEAKSFTYRVGSSGFKNNLETLKESKLGRKKEFFIKEYQRFKETYDPTANFLLDEEKVLCCYLSSSPHGVGILVNDFPVVDPSILERYFGIGSFTLVDSKKGNKEFLFYKNTREAETNLKRYLKELPQLYHYKNCFSYSNTYFPDFYEGKKVEFSEAFFDFRTARVQREIDTLWDLADCWHTSNGLHT